MSKITYQNKVALNVNSNIADINKVNASDMNEIKTVVNDNDDVLNIVKRSGLQITEFGDILTTDGTYTANCYAKVVGTNIGNNIWKIELEGQFLNNNAGSNYYNWGISITKINTLLSLNLQNYINTEEASSYNLYTSTGTLDLSINGIATLFEYKDSLNALLPARYYNSSGSTGGWGLDAFSNGKILKATLYLKLQ